MKNNNKILIKLLRYINLFVLLFSKVIIDNLWYQLLITLACSVLPISMRTIKNRYHKKNKIIWFEIGCAFIMLLLIIICLKSNYGIEGALLDFAFLIIAYLEFSDELADIYSDKVIFKIIYSILSVVLVYWLIYNLRIHKKYFYFYNIGYDKNYSGVLIFFYFCFCLKNKFKIGQLVSGIYALILKSRLLLLMLIFTYVLKIIFNNKINNKFINRVVNKIMAFKTKDITLMFFLITILVTMFSFFVTKYVPESSISKYGESLNDTSNAIRVRANYFAINQILHNPKFIFEGYDNKIKSALGIENELTATKYFGFRLVQPHNFILNYTLRYGLILTIIYVVILSKILCNWWNKENVPIIISYMLMNMSMHSLLSTIYLIIFLLIIVIQKNSRAAVEGENNNERYQ